MSLSDKDYQKKLDFQMADETVAAVKVSRANRQLEQKGDCEKKSVNKILL
ncbi:hypothetical protein LI205_10150 [bacterium MSK18_59]|nr:hypothetical protein [bacterium MSK18_59]